MCDECSSGRITEIQPRHHQPEATAGTRPPHDGQVGTAPPDGQVGTAPPDGQVGTNPPEAWAGTTPHDAWAGTTPHSRPPLLIGLTLVEWDDGGHGCPHICAPNAAQGPIVYGDVFSSGHTEPPAHAHCDCPGLNSVGILPVPIPRPPEKPEKKPPLETPVPMPYPNPTPTPP